MIRVMLVEDEPPILRSIKSAIESAGRGFEVVTCAGDGDEALKNFDSILPDVVFTDIRMPVMSGIELLAKIKERYADVITVIISGYQDFEYAKGAIQHGAFDYLLKPVSLTDMGQLLDKISGRYKSRVDELQQLYISRALYDDSDDSIASMQVKFDYRSYLAVLLCAGPFTNFSMDYFCPAREYWKTFSLKKAAASLIYGNDKAWVLDGKASSERVVVFGFGKDSGKAPEEIAQALFALLPSSRYSVTLVVSAVFNSFQDMGVKMQFLRLALNTGIVTGYSQIIAAGAELKDVNRSSEKIIKMDAAIAEELELLLKNRNIKRFKSELLKAFKQLEELKCPQILMERIVGQIASLCGKYASSAVSAYDPSRIQLGINEAFASSFDAENLFCNLWYIFEEILGVDEKICEDDSRALMKKIDSFISKNIAEPINNQMLSQKFGLVPTYLSKLFKNYKGMSPYEYLISLRMEKAKELLKAHPDMLTKDIALMVGYSDSLHFSKIFKREVKVSPSEYKTLNGF